MATQARKFLACVLLLPLLENCVSRGSGMKYSEVALREIPFLRFCALKPWQIQYVRYCFSEAFGSKFGNLEGISVDKWLRSIDRGFA